MMVFTTRIIEMTNQEIKQLMIDGKLTITDVIDAFIDLNAIIGVGLISLGDDLSDYIIDYGKQRKTIK